GELLADISLLELPAERLDVAALLAKAPLSEAERAELTGLLTVQEDALPEVAFGDLSDYLYSISYETFLKKHGGIRSERLLTFLRNMPAGYFGVGTDAVPALEAMLFGLPGLNKTGVPGADWLAEQAVDWLVEPYIYHYPDGNATIARALVRSLIPSICPPGDARQLVLERFRYDQLDRSEHNVRLRLSSTVIAAANDGDGVSVKYHKDGRLHSARGRQSVLACYNMMIPYLCPELPETQKAALKSLVKAPLVYTNVALRNWEPLARAGVGMAITPSAFHDYFMVDFPVSVPGYDFSPGPESPVLLHFSAALTAPGLTPREQHRVGRAKLLGTPFSTIEADVRATLQEVFGPFGFEADRDMAAITVNRWPHGYAYGHHSLFDPDYEPGTAPHEIGRARHGNITIANSDAGARAYLDEAINQGHRAVTELFS
ncbi:MAG: spermidine dehydrogenase, partial [Pseudomonadota bacterium]